MESLAFTLCFVNSTLSHCHSALQLRQRCLRTGHPNALRHAEVPKNKPFPIEEELIAGAVEGTRTLDLRQTAGRVMYIVKAVEGTRTLDLRITSAPLYQLSYNGSLRLQYMRSP